MFKKITILFLLFLSILYANDTNILSKNGITVSVIKKDTLSKNLDINSSLSTGEWFKVNFDNKVKTGLYILHYPNYQKINFSTIHKLDEFNTLPNHIFFKYDGNTKVFYINFSKPSDSLNYNLNIYPLNDYLKIVLKIIDKLWILVIYVILTGMVLMASVYAAILYIFNKDRVFLYYSLMQFFITLVLSFQLGLFNKLLYNYDFMVIYSYMASFAALFAGLFTYAFLEIKKYTPKLNKFFMLYIVLIFIDMLYYKDSFLTIYNFYSIAPIIFIIAGYIRLRQGFTSAKYYLIGWFLLTLSIMAMSFLKNYLATDINTIFLGVVAEAIMFAFAISNKVKELNNQKQRYLSLLSHSNKIESMHNLLANIAHQWRQPLSTISYSLMSIKRIDKKDIRDKKSDKMLEQIEFLSNTIDDFSEFYQIKKANEEFNVFDEIKFVESMIMLENIKIEYKIESNKTINSYKNEFRHVVLNILLNAKEILLERNIKKPVIKVTIKDNSISIEDSGGGIKTNNIQEVFNQNYSTKKGGIGIGLYLAKIITQEFLNGDIEAKNTKNGAVFIIYFKS